jgi:hypothetical protein
VPLGSGSEDSVGDTSLATSSLEDSTFPQQKTAPRHLMLSMTVLRWAQKAEVA